MYDRRIPGGREVMAHDIEQAINSTLGLGYFAKLDIVNCFHSINLSHASQVLPIGRKVIQHTVAVNPLEAIDRRTAEHLRWLRPYSRRNIAQAFASETPQVLPQGATCSPRVAYSLIEADMPPTEFDREFMFGDDFLILDTSPSGVTARIRSLVQALDRHPAGPLQLAMDARGALQDGGDIVGINFVTRSIVERVHPDQAPAVRRFVHRTVSRQTYARFLDNVNVRIKRAVEHHDPELTEACRYIRQFLNAAPTDDHAFLIQQAMAIARDWGADDGRILDVVASSLND
jgi:hypothetical protein